MKKSIITFVIATIILGSIPCYGIGDGVLRVKGNVVDANNSPVNNCFLELYLAENLNLLCSRKIESSFDVSFMVAPQLHEFFMVIQCPEISKSYKTGVYKITGSNYYEIPLDIGFIRFKK